MPETPIVLPAYERTLRSDLKRAQETAGRSGGMVCVDGPNLEAALNALDTSREADVLKQRVIAAFAELRDLRLNGTLEGAASATDRLYTILNLREPFTRERP